MIVGYDDNCNDDDCDDGDCDDNDDNDTDDNDGGDDDDYIITITTIIFSKTYEKLMHKRLSSFVTYEKIIYLLKSGFQECNLVDHALTCMTEAIKIP